MRKLWKKHGALVHLFLARMQGTLFSWRRQKLQAKAMLFFYDWWPLSCLDRRPTMLGVIENMGSTDFHSSRRSRSTPMMCFFASSCSSALTGAQRTDSSPASKKEKLPLALRHLRRSSKGQSNASTDHHNGRTTCRPGSYATGRHLVEDGNLEKDCQSFNFRPRPSTSLSSGNC